MNEDDVVDGDSLVFRVVTFRKPDWHKMNMTVDLKSTCEINVTDDDDLPRI